ncbi:hypothetical protein RYX45_09090 [Alkalihalophilus pseudofirmus]|uniref:Uncharacterized protein n=1 Tax=Alkalihalophilus pseudofirmus TaxID=79885 RepID=A0AAJ2NMZ7_ALKPS|nr:hypothetical protein [Alkalihalophilus pseudofirmus]MDV2885338.1 hypothetical protein [Alkalihalophilus pseudofirmus]
MNHRIKISFIIFVALIMFYSKQSDQPYAYDLPVNGASFYSLELELETSYKQEHNTAFTLNLNQSLILFILIHLTILLYHNPEWYKRRLQLFLTIRKYRSNEFLFSYFHSNYS